MTPREVLALAIGRALTRRPDLNVIAPFDYEVLDALLLALREPSAEQLLAGNAVTEDAGDVWMPSDGISIDGPSCALECWQAMIDVLLSAEALAKVEREGS